MEYLWFAIFSGRLPRDTPSCAVRCPARVHGDGLDVWVRRVRRCAADTHTPSLAMPLTISENKISKSLFFKHIMNKVIKTQDTTNADDSEIHAKHEKTTH
jgi:hypothetical protein